MQIAILGCGLLLIPRFAAPAQTVDPPAERGELIFPPGSVANYPSCHASTLVELSDGALLAAWYAGTEEGAEDTAELGARFENGAWSKPAVLADTPHKPDGNPVLRVDKKNRVWLFYVSIESAGHSRPWTQCRVKARISVDNGRTFGREGIVHEELGWMTRNKPVELSTGVLLLPLYDERDWTSHMLLSADDGATWTKSQSIVAPGGNIQPTVVELNDGSLLAFMRTGSERARLWKSTSRDHGRTWTAAVGTEFPNPNSACDMARLANGHLVLVYNDTRRGRTPLTAALSTDEGLSWPVKRNLETAGGEFSYPAVIQTHDGMIHGTYTWLRKSIKHVAFNEAWIRGNYTAAHN